ncbi:NADH:flavin oxidoreductase [Halobacteriales archaeon QS_3_64_16]|nr:MAG: NADH:flavin oxidoreductase [Halobacteriales archaeon QS_3_64_16]
MAADPLFEPFELNGLSLDNRVGLAPMTRTSATEDGHPTDRMARYYRSFARGGFSFLVTEGTYTDETHSQGYPGQPGLATDAQAEAWQPVVEAVHEEERPIFAQLMHAGAQAQHEARTAGTVAPSAYQPPGEMAEVYGGSGKFPEAEALDAEGLAAVKSSFVDAATRALDAGFDGIEVHAANGYLLHEFLDPLVNERTDQYGGTPENRARFPAEVVAAIDEATPDKFVVGVRVSQGAVTDEDRTWPDERATARAVFEALTEAGAGYLHVTEPAIAEPAFGSEGPTLTQLAADHGDTVVIANGGIGTPEKARGALAAGADLLTQATAALANHDWPKRVREGQELDDLDPSVIFQPDASISDAEIPSDD